MTTRFRAPQRAPVGIPAAPQYGRENPISAMLAQPQTGAPASFSALQVPEWLKNSVGGTLPQFPAYEPARPLTEEELRVMNKQPFRHGMIGGQHGGNKSMAMILGM